ncbi:hypothetical protein DAKH74_055160 [Maudiozyma humilis]|uniref:Uncharacterized protein n=1 Tax=Maudiozyma humilis TaxID=51915 RepID=A0AAV5S4W3_MAUHU|nr:hypothetical protein DAKH74_055160 [Kazachstania humilis]
MNDLELFLQGPEGDELNDFAVEDDRPDDEADTVCDDINSDSELSEVDSVGTQALFQLLGDYEQRFANFVHDSDSDSDLDIDMGVESDSDSDSECETIVWNSDDEDWNDVLQFIMNPPENFNNINIGGVRLGDQHENGNARDDFSDFSDSSDDWDFTDEPEFTFQGVVPE